MSEEFVLLRCPFCGQEKPLIAKTSRGWTIECIGCFVQIGAFPTERTAARAWNTRPALQSDDRTISDAFFEEMRAFDEKMFAETGGYAAWYELKNLRAAKNI